MSVRNTCFDYSGSVLRWISPLMWCDLWGIVVALTKREARNSEAVTQEEVSGDNEDAEMEESGKGGSQDAEGQKGDEDDSSISSILHFVSKEKVGGLRVPGLALLSVWWLLGNEDIFPLS